MDYVYPLKYHNPIDQKVDQVQKKLVRLHTDEENLAKENRQLHKEVSHLALKNQVILENLPLPWKGVLTPRLDYVWVPTATNDQVELLHNNSRTNTTDFDLIEQKIDQVQEKIGRLEAGHERLAIENRQFHQQVSYLAIKNQVRIADLPHSDKALLMLSVATTPANNEVKMSANNSKWSTAKIFI